MTIKSLHLENFQSHEETTVQLDPGVNVIIGPSDSGKTAIIRALRWLAWNKPGGTAFRSSWGGDTKVSVKLDDGVGIYRVRTDKHNAYYIDDMPYEAFGAEPPEDVVAKLNLQDVNLQQQLDRPFLLDSSPGQVASYLNEVARLDIIDIALQRLNKWIREIGSKITNDEARKAQLEESLATFEYLPAMEEAVESLEKQSEDLDEHTKSMETLQGLVRSYKSVAASRAKLDKLTSLAGPVHTALGLCKALKEAQTEFTALQSTMSKLRRVDQQIQELSPMQHLKGTVDKAVAAYEEYNDAKGKHDSLLAMISKIRQREHSITERNKQVKKLRHQFHEEMGDQCPLCEKRQN